MKIKGQSIQPPPNRLIPLPREDGDVFLQAQPVMDFEEFDKLCPEPKPPLTRDIKSNTTKLEFNDPGYLKKQLNHSKQRTAYMIIKSLEATPGLEWDQVDINVPETWDGYLKELQSCFTVREVDVIIDGIFSVNMPSEEAQREAKERFMLSQAEEAQRSTFPTVELDSTSSTESANDSE